MPCPSVISLFPLSLNKCQASLDVIDGEPQQCMRQQSYISLLHGGGGRAQSLTESYHLSLRPPSLRSNLASAAHYQPAVAHLTQISAQESTLKKTKLRKKKFWRWWIFFKLFFSEVTVQLRFSPAKFVVSLWSNIQALFAMCKPPLCWRGYSPTKNTLCFTMWRNKPNWDAVTCTSGTYSGANAVSLLAMKSPPSPPLSASLQQTVSSVHLGLNNQLASFQLWRNQDALLQ